MSIPYPAQSNPGFVDLTPPQNQRGLVASDLNVEFSKKQDYGLNGVSPESFGAIGDGVTDDSAPFQAALNWSGAHGVQLSYGRRYLLATAGTIDVPEDKQITGWARGGLRASGASFADLPGCLILGPSTTIRLGAGGGHGRAAIKNCAITQQAASIPALTLAQAIALPGLFTGTAVTINGEDCRVEDCTILGFTQAVSSVGWGRAYLCRISFDCTNGLHIEGGYDRGQAIECEGWPFLSAQAQIAIGADRPAFMARNGIAYNFKGACDWADATGCFAYGYTTAFQSDSSSTIRFINCKADNLGFPATGALPGGGTYSQGNPNGITKAFSATNNALNLNLITCHTNNHVYGAVNSSALSDSSEGRMTIIGGEFITQGDSVLANGSGGVVVNSARLQASGFGTATVLTTSYGVKLLAGSGLSTIVNNYIYGCASGAFSIDASLLTYGIGQLVKFGNILNSLNDAYFDIGQNSLVVGGPGQQGALLAIDRRASAPNNGGYLAVGCVNGGGDPITNIQWQIEGDLQNGTSGSEQSNLVFRTYYAGAFQERIKLSATGHILPIVTNTQNLGSSSVAWNQIWLNSASFVSITTGNVPGATGVAGQAAIQIDEANGYLYLATHTHVYRLTGTQVV